MARPRMAPIRRSSGPETASEVLDHVLRLFTGLRQVQIQLQITSGIITTSEANG